MLFPVRLNTCNRCNEQIWSSASFGLRRTNCYNSPELFIGHLMEKRKLQRAFRGGLLTLLRVGKSAVILSLTLFAIQPSVWAQPKTGVMECTMQNGKIVDKSGHPMGDCVLMKDGQMMMITKGKMMPIKKDITLADGTICKVDGTCIVKGGKQIKLTNGEGIEVALGRFSAGTNFRKPEISSPSERNNAQSRPPERSRHA